MSVLVSCGSARCYPKVHDARALQLQRSVDVFLSIGTSGIVYPAAELPLRAIGHGATVAHINPLRFDVSSQEHFLQGPASTRMKSLLQDAFGDVPAL